MIPSGPAREVLLEVFKVVYKNPEEFAKLLETLNKLKNSDELLGALAANPEAFKTVLEAGPDAVEELLKHEDEAIQLVKGLDEDGVKAVLEGGDEFSAGDASFMDGNDDFLMYISNRSDIDANGYYDIIAHGSSDGIQITHNGEKIIVDSRTAARLIQNVEGYNGQSIRLLSCNTGALDSGFAQNLANKLNINVYAPNNYLWSTPDGNYFVAGMTKDGLPDLTNIGDFVLFTPGK
jgi:hypothetical protein